MKRNGLVAVLTMCVCACGWAQSPVAALPTTAATAVPPADFSAGLKAMDEQRWSDALKAFDRVESTEHGEYAAAALYWKAYNLEKLGRADDARTACGMLRSNAPESPWNTECAAMRADQRITMVKLNDQLHELSGSEGSFGPGTIIVDTGVSGGPDHFLMTMPSGIAGSKGSVEFGPSKIDPNIDLKLLALNSLMQQEPDKALPILRTYLNSDQPLEVRRRAMFVLGESQNPTAQKLLMDMATKSGDPAMQRTALQTLATMRGKEVAPVFVKIYESSTDHGVKRAALSGLFMANDAKDLVGLARQEKDIQMKRDIVTQLTLMRDPAATAYMEELLK